MKARLTQLTLILISLAGAQAHAQVGFCGYQCPVSHFPQTVNLFNAIQESARHTPQVCDEKLSKLFQDQDSEAVIGARKVMALTYGSCDVLTQPVRGRRVSDRIPASAVQFDGVKREFSVEKSAVLANHPYLQDRQSSACGDVQICSSKKPEELSVCEAAACMALTHPPLYQFDQRVRNHSAFEKVQKGETGALGMDDSSFISEAFSMMGIRVRPDQVVDQVQTRKGGLSNAEFWVLGEKDASGKNLDCFDRVAGRVGIHPGDLIATSKSHTAMIDTVGNDPFGIEALRKKSSQVLQLNLQTIMKEKGVERSHMISPYNHSLLMKTKLDDVLNGGSNLDRDLQESFLDELAIDACEHLLRKPEDYRVTLIHSSPRGGYVGIQREKVFPGLGDPEVLSSQAAQFRLKVQADCIQTLRADWLARVPAKNSGIRSYLASESKFVAELKKRENDGKGTRILRLNPTYDGCRAGLGERPLIEANQCVRCCQTQSRYEALVPGEPAEVQAW